MSEEPPGSTDLADLRSKVAGLRIGIVHYGEHVTLDDGYRPARMGQLAAWLTDAGASVVRFVPTYSHFAGRQRPLSWTGTLTPEGHVVMVPTRSFDSNRGPARLAFFADFARGTAAAAAELDPFDSLIVGFPPPGVTSALRARLRPCPPILADIRDLWPDALLTTSRPALTAATATVGHGLAAELRLTGGVVAMSETMLARAPWSRRRRPIPHSVSSALASVTPTVSPTDGLRVAFVGILNDFFDLDGVVSGWLQFLERRGSVTTTPHLSIYGTGPLEDELRRRVSDVESVTLRGWLPSADVPAAVAGADVGIAPTQPGLGTTLSNKVLEYVGTGAFVLHTLEDEASTVLARDGLGKRVEATSDGWADGFQELECRLGQLREARSDRQATALDRYGRDAIERLWMEEIAALSKGGSGTRARGRTRPLSAS